MKSAVLAAWLAGGALLAQTAKVTPLMNKDLAGIAGKEGVVLTVEYAPGASSASSSRDPRYRC